MSVAMVVGGVAFLVVVISMKRDVERMDLDRQLTISRRERARAFRSHK